MIPTICTYLLKISSLSHKTVHREIIHHPPGDFHITMYGVTQKQSTPFHLCSAYYSHSALLITLHSLHLNHLSHICRYFYLLSEPVPPYLLESASSDPSGGQPLTRFILHYVFNCLFSSGVSRKLCSFVMEMVVNLLCEKDPLEECTKLTHVEEMEVECNRHNCSVVAENSEEHEIETVTRLLDEGEQLKHLSTSNPEGSCYVVSTGVKLIIPFIPVLLKYLGSVIRGDRRGNLQLEFSVLSK